MTEALLILLIVWSAVSAAAVLVCGYERAATAYRAWRASRTGEDWDAEGHAEPTR